MGEKSEYKNRIEWKNANPRDYDSALNNGFMDKICEQFGWDKPKKMVNRHPNGYWTIPRILEDAKKYNTPKEWSQKSSSGYAKSFKTEGLFQECVSHMSGTIKPKGYWTDEIIFKASKEFKSPTEWKCGCSMSYTLALKNKVLYKKCFDYMGMVERKSFGYWDDKENVLNDAKKYTTKSAWGTGPNSNYSAYNSAKKNGWFEEATKHMVILVRPKGYWTLDRCKTEAKKHKTPTEWFNNCPTSMSYSRSHGWYKECVKHMNYIHNGHWNSKENILSEARKYKTRSEWSRGSGSSYTMAKKKGWFDECVEHMNYASGHTPAGYWTKEKVLKIAKKYKTRIEWVRNSEKSVNAARNHGWLDECTEHMLGLTKPVGYWNIKGNVLKEAIKYKSKTEWVKASSGSKKSAIRNGWYKECTKHMK